MKRANVSFPGGAISTYWLDMTCNPSKVCLSEAFNIGGGGAVGMGVFLHWLVGSVSSSL